MIYTGIMVDWFDKVDAKFCMKLNSVGNVMMPPHSVRGQVWLMKNLQWIML